MNIDNNFFNYYLIPGNTYDNFIFENCSNEFMAIAQQSLSVYNNGVKTCCIIITKDNEQILENVLDNCTNDFQKKYWQEIAVLL